MNTDQEMRIVRALETIAEAQSFWMDTMKEQDRLRKEYVAEQKRIAEEYYREQELARQVEEATPEDLKEKVVTVDPRQLQTEFMYNMNQFLKKQLGHGEED